MELKYSTSKVREKWVSAALTFRTLTVTYMSWEFGNGAMAGSSIRHQDDSFCQSPDVLEGCPNASESDLFGCLNKYMSVPEYF